MILYELLTGRTPFQGTTMEVLDQVRHADPVPPRRIEPEIPGEPGDDLSEVPGEGAGQDATAAPQRWRRT